MSSHPSLTDSVVVVLSGHRCNIIRGRRNAEIDLLEDRNRIIYIESLLKVGFCEATGRSQSARIRKAVRVIVIRNIAAHL